MIIEPRDWGYDNLPSTVTRRIRAADTLFGRNVKLVMRELTADMWSVLPADYLLVVPTVTRVATGNLAAEPPNTELLLPRSITLIAQIDSKNSADDYLAAQVVEDAEKQLLGCLAGWRPHPGYMPTAYAGMRLEGSRAPLVKASFVYLFPETISLDCPETGCVEPDGSELGMVRVHPIDLTCEVDPCL